MRLQMFFKAVHEEKRPVKASVRTTSSGQVVPVQAHQANRKISDQNQPRQLNLFGQQDLFAKKPELAAAKDTIEDKPKAEGKPAFSNKVASWFTGTVFCNVKHPTQGKHQLTPEQIKNSPVDYKNKLFASMKAAYDRGDLTDEHIRAHGGDEKAATEAKPEPKEKTKTLPDGRVFPVYNDEVLSWDPTGYNTTNEQKQGFPRARAVIAAMRETRPEELEKLYRQLTRDSFDRMFGHNAATMQKIVGEELSKPMTKKQWAIYEDKRKKISEPKSSPVEQAKATIEADSAKTKSESEKPYYEDFSIGKTRSGKHVYDRHKDHKHDDFTMQDHMDAAAFHEKLATDWTRRGMMGDEKASERAYNHSNQAQAHHKKAGVNDAWDTMPKNIHDEYAKAKEHANKTMDLGALEGAGLPKNLADLTGDQTYSIIKQLSKKPLKELRKRQDLVADQIKLAYQKQDIETARNLEIQERHLTTAVDWKGFPEDAPKSAKEM